MGDGASTGAVSYAGAGGHRRRWRLRVPGDRHLARAACTAWVVYIVVLGVVVAISLARDPTYRIASHVYRHASLAWWQRADMYLPFNDRGFLYLPQSAILYTPFTWGSLTLGELLLRAVTGVLFTIGLACVAALGDRRRFGARFLLFTLVCLPLAGQSDREGQLNSLMTAFMLLGTAALGTRRWTSAAVALVLALAVKPLAVVLLLLAVASHPRAMLVRVGVGLAVLFLVPYAVAPASYATTQYAHFAHKIAVANAPPTSYYDIRGLLETGFALHLAPSALTAMRGIAAIVTLALSLHVARRPDLTRVALVTYALAVCYLTLFNPKTEGPTYVLLAPAFGIFLVRALLDRRDVLLGATFVAMAYACALSYEIWGSRQYWFRPAVALLFTGIVAASALARRAPPRSAPT